MISITSRSNNLIKYLVSLKKKKRRKNEDLFILEGLSTIKEAVENGYDMPYLIVLNDHLEKPVYKEIVETLETTETQVITVSKRVIETLSDTVNSQGIIAVPRKINWDEKKLFEDRPCFIIALDDIKDPGNMGTILRLAESVKASGVILSENCVDIYNNKVVRSSRGAIFSQPIIRPKNFFEFIHDIQKKGVKLLTTLPAAERSYWDTDLTQDCMLIMGNEAMGVSEEIQNIADIDINIPIPGNMESLNVAVAASIITYEMLRQRTVKGI